MIATAKERPIIFSAEMVRAILEGRKTQTRRVITPQPIGELSELRCPVRDGEVVMDYGLPVRRIPPRLRPPHGDWEPMCFPYGKRGDRLWVRETYRVIPNDLMVGIGSIAKKLLSI